MSLVLFFYRKARQDSEAKFEPFVLFAFLGVHFPGFGSHAS